VGSKRSPRYVVSPKAERSYRLLDTHTGNLVEFLETPSLEYFSEICRQHNRAWSEASIGLRSFSRRGARQMTTQNTDRTARLASIWCAEQDRAQFAIAVRRLNQLEDDGQTLPLHFSLPTGRSIESLCVRAAHLHDELPSDVLMMLRKLAVAVAVSAPSINSYKSCAPILQAICDRLAVPRDQRQLPRTL
jgi:hypothetical protein